MLIKKVAIFILLITSKNLIFAHEPVFSLGPETIYKGGIGVESELEYEKGSQERELGLHYEMIYGITQDISVSMALPHILEKYDAGDISRGLGETILRAKFQLYRKDMLRAQDKISVIYGIKFPTGNKDRTPPLGSGAFNHILGLSIGHESTTLYGFAATRYVLKNKNNGIKKGNQIFLDIAFGFRPWLRPYRSWDFVLLLENSYIFSYKNELKGIKQEKSGGQRIFTGPTFLWSIRNIMVKGGIQFPVWQDLKEDADELDFRQVIALEYHF